MAHGLVQIGSKRILPAPRSNVMRFAGMSAGGGDPGGGYNPGGNVLVGTVYPNSLTANGFYWYDQYGTGWLIPTYNIEGDEVGMGAEAENTLSVNDDNYVETILYNGPTAEGYRVEYTLTDYTFNSFRWTEYGYGWRTSDSAYGWKAALWNYESEEYTPVHYHANEHKVGQTSDAMTPDDYMDENDIVSHVIQAIDTFNDIEQEGHHRSYFMCLELYG